MPDVRSVVSGGIKPRATRRICQGRVLDYGIGYEEEGLPNMISFEPEAGSVKHAPSNLTGPVVPSRLVRLTAEEVEIMLPYEEPSTIDRILRIWCPVT